MMKFFEVHEPYYALIKALDKEQAIKEYLEVVADDEDGTLESEIKEVERDYALVKFSRATSVDIMILTTKEILSQFNYGGNEILLVDKQLL
jgi:hypothetical protein